MISPRYLQEQKAAYFGEHQGITCDGCGAVPIIGYRFRCKNCPNHDICEACHERWDNGKGSMANGLAKQQISLDPKDHDFFIHKERGFKPLVKTAGPTQKSEKKLKVSTRTGGCSHSRDTRARTNRHQFTVAHRVDSPNIRATPLMTGLNSNPVRSFRSRMIRARAGAVRRRRSAAVEPSRERVARC